MRTLMAVEGKRSNGFQIVALQKAVRIAIDRHGFEKIFLVVRVSPPGERKQSAVSASLIHQKAFVERMIPDDLKIEPEVIQAEEVSAYGDDCITILAKSKGKEDSIPLNGSGPSRPLSGAIQTTAARSPQTR